MYYDNRGRVVQTKGNNALTSGVEKEYIAYNFTGNPTSRKNVHTASGKTTQTEVYTYDYDHAGRPTATTHKLNTAAAVTIVNNAYDELGRLKSTQTNNKANLKVDYTYDVRSRLKNISNPLFGESLKYTYNGNISEAVYKQGNRTENYYYNYDNLSRLTWCSEQNYNDNSMEYEYDLHGNIRMLVRNILCPAQFDNNSYSSEVDHAYFYYTGNQLKSLYEDASAEGLISLYDIKSYANQSVEYTYNKNGAMTQDLNKGISNIKYNLLNLPEQIDIKSPIAEAREEYYYSADGQKIAAIHRWNPNYSTSPVIGTAINTSNLRNVTKVQYLGNLEYDGYSALLKIKFDNGYYSYDDDKNYVYLKDHLGNIRVVADINGNVAQRNDYDPFGMTMPSSINQGLQQYKFGGKEFLPYAGLNLYDVSARWYDPSRIGWLGIDPLCEKYPHISPYVYCLNNPMKFIDPDGRDVFYSEDGNFISEDDGETDYIRIVSGQIDDRGKLKITTKRLENTTISAKAYSNIFTDIFSKMKETDVNRLQNGKIAVYVTKDGKKASTYNSPIKTSGVASTEPYDGDKFAITAKIWAVEGDDNRHLFSTVSNVQNLLGIHEYVGHGLNPWCDDNSDHYKAYEAQMNHFTWNSTTPLFKVHMLHNYTQLLFKEKYKIK
jgi:RHS repeat-associated protein